jgi:hypothetical protein
MPSFSAETSTSEDAPAREAGQPKGSDIQGTYSLANDLLTLLILPQN